MEAVFKRGGGNHWWHLPADCERRREGGFRAGGKSPNPSKWLVSSEGMMLGTILKVDSAKVNGRMSSGRVYIYRILYASRSRVLRKIINSLRLQAERRICFAPLPAKYQLRKGRRRRPLSERTSFDQLNRVNQLPPGRGQERHPFPLGQPRGARSTALPQVASHRGRRKPCLTVLCRAQSFAIMFLVFPRTPLARVQATKVARNLACPESKDKRSAKQRDPPPAPHLCLSASSLPDFQLAKPCAGIPPPPTPRAPCSALKGIFQFHLPIERSGKIELNLHPRP